MKADRSEVWKTIWNKKAQHADVPIHHVDGFDLLTTEQWNDMVFKVTKPIAIKSGDSILECGCGAGAFLSSLLIHYPNLKVAGIDYSKSLIEAVKRNINGDFYLGDMTDISFIKDDQYDHTISFSTFHYLSSEESARKAVREMTRVTKTGGMIYIGEVSDLAKRQEALTIREKTHRNHKRVSAANPDHLFLSKDLFKELAKDMHLQLDIVDQEYFNLPFYETAKYRYSVYLTK